MLFGRFASVEAPENENMQVQKMEEFTYLQ
jgi:hypothetical protein